MTHCKLLHLLIVYSQNNNHIFYHEISVDLLQHRKSVFYIEIDIVNCDYYIVIDCIFPHLFPAIQHKICKAVNKILKFPPDLLTACKTVQLIQIRPSCAFRGRFRIHHLDFPNNSENILQFFQDLAFFIVIVVLNMQSVFVLFVNKFLIELCQHKTKDIFSTFQHCSVNTFQTGKGYGPAGSVFLPQERSEQLIELSCLIIVRIVF